MDATTRTRPTPRAPPGRMAVTMTVPVKMDTLACTTALECELLPVLKEVINDRGGATLVLLMSEHQATVA